MSYQTSREPYNLNYPCYNIAQPLHMPPQISQTNIPFTNDNVAVYDLSVPEFDSKTPDEVWIENWLCKHGKGNLTSQTVLQQSKPHSNVSIQGARKALVQCLVILHKLNCVQNYLQCNVETMSSAEWKRKTIEIGSLKDEFTQAISKFDNNDTVRSLRAAIEKRKKKRLKMKQRKLFKKEQRNLELEKIKNAHKETDLWLEVMKDKVERAKMEEQFKMDADCILSEVTKKKNDSRKQLSLIQALVKLRKVREQAAIQKGEKIPLEDSRAFEKVTSKLTKMWEDMYKIYAKEEQGLRLMLEQNALEDTKAAKIAKQNNIIKEWYNVFFGSIRRPAPSDNYMFLALTAAERDLETFIAIRRSWDTFLVPHDGELGSNIPIGWVLPESSSENWNRYLKH